MSGECGGVKWSQVESSGVKWSRVTEGIKVLFCYPQCMSRATPGLIKHQELLCLTSTHRAVFDLVNIAKSGEEYIYVSLSLSFFFFCKIN